MIRHSVFLVAVAVILVFLCTGCDDIRGPRFRYMTSPRVLVNTPASPANGDIFLSFLIIDREMESVDVAVEYSTDNGVTFSTATLTNAADALALTSAWHPGKSHTVIWDSVTDGVGISGEVDTLIKITPSDASNPSGEASLSGNFVVVNLAHNLPPVATLTTPSGVQFGNVEISYFLNDAESDLCSITAEYSEDGGENWHAAAMGPGGDGASELPSSPAGYSHIFKWDSREDGVASTGRIDTVKIRIIPADFRDGTAGTTSTFSVDNTIVNQSPVVVITGGPADSSTVIATQVTFEWSGSDVGGFVQGYYYSFDVDPPYSWTTATSVTSDMLSEGGHIFRVVAMDDCDELSAVALRGFTILHPEPVTADFSVLPVSGAAPLVVDFTDMSIGPITSWQWDFGDGDSSSEQNPTHAFNLVGNYTITLTVSGPGGSDSETRVDYICVQDPGFVAAEFAAEPTVGTAALSVQFTDISVGDITLWQWDFDNDGFADSTERNPGYAYTTEGIYTVELTVSGPGGTDTETKVDYITVYASGGVVPPLGGSSGGSGGSYPGYGSVDAGGIACNIIVPNSYHPGTPTSFLLVYSGTEGDDAMMTNLLNVGSSVGLGDFIIAVLDGVTYYNNPDAGATVIDWVRTNYNIDNDKTCLLSESAGTGAGLLLGFNVRQSYFAAYWANDVNCSYAPQQTAAQLGFAPWGNAGPGGNWVDADIIVNGMIAAGYRLPPDAPYSGAGSGTHGSLEQFIAALEFFPGKSRQ